MFFVYLLVNKTSGQHYIASTNSLSKRLKQHRSGQFQPTNDSWPMDLVYYEAYDDKRTAIKREDYMNTKEGIEELKERLDLK